MTVQAIETKYAGHRFRSRLEARWAVFFDRAGVKWEYEPQGFIVGMGKRPYLPDFWLPDLKLWVEVKGSDENLDYGLLKDAIDYGMGLPNYAENGLLLLGPIPRIRDKETPVHTLFLWKKGVCLRRAIFYESWKQGVGLYVDEYCFECDSADGLSEKWSGDGKNRPKSLLDPQPDGQLFFFFDKKVDTRGFPMGMWRYVDIDPKLEASYEAARSARFEHGESG